MWMDVVEVFQKYMGTGLIIIWFLAALIYLFLTEEIRERRIFFVYIPLVVLALFFNPLFSRVFSSFLGSEIYFRMCWLLPVILVIAYAAVHIIERAQGAMQVWYSVLALVLIGCSGRLVYTNSRYSIADNIYHVPDAVVSVCNEIRVPGREVMAVFPPEYVLYVRQYDGTICMPYGREGFDDEVNNEFRDAMRREIYDLEELVQFAQESHCHYVIFDNKKEILGEPQDFGWDVFSELEEVTIYRNTAEELITEW